MSPHKPRVRFIIETACADCGGFDEHEPGCSGSEYRRVIGALDTVAGAAALRQLDVLSDVAFVDLEAAVSLAVNAALGEKEMV